MIGALLLVAELVMRGVLAGVLTAGLVFCAWLVWDVTVGPTGRAAAARRRRPGSAGGA